MKVIISAILFLMLFISLPVFSQDGWYLLADVTIEKRYDELMMQETDFPIFGDQLVEADGKEIKLTGYMVPLDDLLHQQSFVLSSLPFQTCFFCGGAGPETVAEVRTINTYQYTDNRITVKGTLRLNDANPFELYYILEGAEIID